MAPVIFVIRSIQLIELTIMVFLALHLPCTDYMTTVLQTRCKRKNNACLDSEYILHVLYRRPEAADAAKHATKQHI